jgi:tRNA G18 (ribose-2'-O)-methylase SpoU
MSGEKSNTKSSKEVGILQPTILVMGSENKGIRPSIQKICDSFTTIYGASNVKYLDSLNVNVATGILIHQLKNKTIIT